MAMDVATLHDDELIRRCRYRRWESVLSGGPGCVVSLLMGAVLATLVVVSFAEDMDAARDPWWVTAGTIVMLAMGVLAAVVIGSAVVMFVLMGVATARPGRYHKEARRRFLPPTGDGLRQIMLRAKRERPPAWMVALHVRVLPRGGTFALLLRQEPGAAGVRVDYWQCPDVSLSDADPRPQAAYAERTLDATESAELKALLDAWAAGPYVEKQPRVMDGLPYALLWAADGAALVEQLPQRFVSLHAVEEGDRLGTLVARLIRLRERFEDRPMIYGACDAGGNVTVSEV